MSELGTLSRLELAPLPSLPYKPAPNALFNVIRAGVVGDGETVNTVAIQRVINDCAAAGGGTVLFPAGRYLTGTIQIKRHVTLRLEAGAILLGSTNDAAAKHNISLEQSASNLDGLVRDMHEQNPRMDIVLQTMNPAWDSPDEPAGKRSSSDRPNLAEYYELYRRYARLFNLPLIDHHRNWLEIQEQDLEKFQQWLPDGCHPISEASLAVTWPAIRAMLESARHAAKV